MCEDSIFYAAGCIGGEACPFFVVKAVHRFDEADRSDTDEVLLVRRRGIIFFGHMRHQTQIVADQQFLCCLVARRQTLEGFDLSARRQRLREA